MNQQLFPLGQTVATPGALAALAEAYGEQASRAGSSLLWRHVGGDWGEVCPEDSKANADALKHGLRLLSSYTLPTGARVWIITEADRSATTLLLPEDY